MVTLQKTFEPGHEISNNLTGLTSVDSYQMVFSQ